MPKKIIEVEHAHFVNSIIHNSTSQQRLETHSGRWKGSLTLVRIEGSTFVAVRDEDKPVLYVPIQNVAWLRFTE